MLFLNFWDDVFANLGTLVERLLNILWLILCQIVYPFISLMFATLTNITGSLTDGRYAGDVNEIINRVILILTIVMTFYIVFEFVKYTVTPDSITDKEKGAMPLFARIIIAILLLAFVPKIFSLASKLQYKVIETNVIGKVVLGASTSNNDIAGLGREFSGELLGSFMYVKCYSNENKNSKDCKAAYDSVDEMVKQAKSTVLIPGASITFSNPRIRFAGLLALIVGCFVLYVVFLYCKDIALREIQLIFLQIISPIAIMSYIAPKKDSMFQKWLKQSLTTYVDIFIRLAVLYFMLLMINLLGVKLLYEGKNDNNIIAYVFLIIGLMMFLKKVPKLLQELFPSAGAASIGYGFSAKDRKGILGDAIGAGSKVAARTAGSIAGGARGIKGRKNLLSEAHRNQKGFKAGLRKVGTYGTAIIKGVSAGYTAGKDGKIGDAIKAGQEKIQTYESIVAAGGTVLGHDFGAGHYQNLKANIQVQLDLLKQMTDAKGAVGTEIQNIKYRKQMDTIAATLQARGDVEAATAWGGEIKAFEKIARRYATGEIKDEATYINEVSGLIKNFNEKYYGSQSDKYVLASSDGNGGVAVDTVTLSKALDTGNVAVYGAISTKMKEAQTVAQAISKQTFTITEEQRQPDGTIKEVRKDIVMPTMNDDGTFIDKDGKTVTFAEFIGDFTDATNAAKVNIEADVRTKRAKANSEGKK